MHRTRGAAARRTTGSDSWRIRHRAGGESLGTTADAPTAESDAQHAWPDYLAGLQRAGVLQGGSAIGDGICVSKRGAEGEIARHISGYLKVRAASIDAARALLEGNPVYEAGGTVEIRELPRTE